MRKLSYSLSTIPLSSLKSQIVPALFTSHQFDLLQKKQRHFPLTPSQKNEFSRSISRKMNAIYALLQKKTSSPYIYGKDNIIPSRLPQAIQLLKQYNRKFKSKHVILTGSFLYSKKYNDIDIIVISKYEKTEQFHGNIHISYFTPDVYHSLFFASVQQLCLSNQEIQPQPITEKISLDTFLALYQEILTDIDHHPHALKYTLRDFLLQSAHLSHLPLPNSSQLKQQTDAIIKSNNHREILKNIFTHTLFFTATSSQLTNTLSPLINSYKDLSKEYPKFKSHYKDLIHTFQQVIALARKSI